jgi:hypothetical protein
MVMSADCTGRLFNIAQSVEQSSPTNKKLGFAASENFDAMMKNFESRRDKEFASHDCATHSKNQNPHLTLPSPCESGWNSHLDTPVLDVP